MKRTNKHLFVWSLLAVAAIASVFPLLGRKAKAGPAEEAAVRPAAVVLAEKKPLSNSLTLSADFIPFQEVDVHAKIAGYIRKIYVDVGDRVKAGQTLAILEVPELNAQVQGAQATTQRSKDAIRRAQGDLDRAQSLHAATHLDYTRLKQAAAARPGLIAEQELDDSLAKDKEGEADVAAKQAALSEAQSQLGEALAEQQRFGAMSNYTRITAPFDGIVTKRYVDTGALVQAGTNSNTQALPVVRVAETDRFRLVLPVPESAVPAVRLGSAVTVNVPSLKRSFEGKISRYADAVTPETRTMHTEVDVRNETGGIVQGMYAQVTLALTRTDPVLTVPVQAVTRNGDEASVLIVDRNDRVEERHVQLGLEGSDELQVLNGLSVNDRVIVGARAEYRPGDVVAPKLVGQSQGDNF
jgi:RND family efflux transporter MFP subunit